jgi:glycosyltransferase involved in cell wall biosynthesis
LAIFYIYGIDVTIQSVLQKGNFDQMRMEVENLSKISEVYLSTKDAYPYSRLFKGSVQHLYSRLFGLPDNAIGKSLTGVIFFGAGFVSFMRRVKKVDVVFSQGTTSFHGALANFFFHKPVILCLHYFAYNEQTLLRRNVISPLFRLIELFTVRHCSIVVAPDERLKARALAIGAKSARIIPNFVSATEINKISSKDDLRRKLSLERTANVILFVGRLHPVKNIDILLKALSNLNRSKKCVLVIVGDGPEGPRLKEMALSLGIHDLVRFEGFKPKKTVLEYMKASDVLVLPSLVEGQPRVVLEAWAIGLPIVASKVSGIDNLINNGVNGLLFTLPSVELFLKAIANALDGELASNLRLNGKKRVDEYGVTNILLAYQRLVKQFVSKEKIK